MAATERPPNPQRYARVEQLVRDGEPDREVVRVVSEEFKCCKNTVYSDLQRLWSELRTEADEKRQHRRDAMRFSLESLHAEARRLSRLAAAGGTQLNRKGEEVVVQDFRAAAVALTTAEKAAGRLASLDGLNESDATRIEMLRQKLASTLTAEELESALLSEIERLVVTMPAEKWERLVARRAAAMPASMPAAAAAAERVGEAVASAVDQRRGGDE